MLNLKGRGDPSDDSCINLDLLDEVEHQYIQLVVVAHHDALIVDFVDELKT